MEAKKKKGLQLMGKISVVVAIPMAALVLLGCLIGVSGMNGVSDILMKEQLESAEYSFGQIMDGLSDGDYRYENGTLYKGDYDVTANENVLTEFKENTGIEVSIVVGNVRGATTMSDADGKSMKGQSISETVYKKLKAGEADYDQKLKIGSKNYLAYYLPIKNASGEIYGSLFVGYDKNTVSAMTRSNIYKMVGTLCVIAVAVMAVIAFLMRSIGKVLHNTVGHLEEVADGSLDVMVQNKVLERNDELGEVSRSLQKLVSSFKEIVKNIMTASAELDSFSGEFKESFDNIKESISNINTAVDEIANGATQQAGDTQRANEEVINMGDALDSTAGNVIALTDSAQKMSDYNSSANEILEELLEISKKTNQSVDDVQKQTDETNRSAMEIQEATELIASIASQTNLLSLNASIEAARAGEQGRGFAVVAGEIRTLADQCSESADKIANVVHELLDNSNQSVHTMNEVMVSIEQQNEKLENTLKMYAQLNDEIHTVSQAIHEISAQVDGLGDAKNAVLELLESLSAISEENAASTQQTSASMIELSNIVEECTEKTAGLLTLSTNLRDNTTKFSIDVIKDNINDMKL